MVESSIKPVKRMIRSFPIDTSFQKALFGHLNVLHFRVQTMNHQQVLPSFKSTVVLDTTSLRVPIMKMYDLTPIEHKKNGGCKNCDNGAPPPPLV